MMQPEMVYKGIFAVATLFLVTEGITAIINTKNKGTKTFQATQWIRSLCMIVIGMAILFLALSSAPSAEDAANNGNFLNSLRGRRGL
jgi:hypothetical protein